MEQRIRTVVIGAGYRGKYLLRLLQAIPVYEILAVADPEPAAPEELPCPLYAQGASDYRRMIDECRPELVFIASPWRFHVEQGLYALQQGCHIALEIRGGLVQDEYRPLLEESRKRNLSVYPLENTLFLRENMAMVRLVRAGLLGELVAMRGGYRHDLRDMLVDASGGIGNPAKPEGIWRSRFYLTENADLYPTHGLAPLCLAAGIPRTDPVVELTAFASRACGLNAFVRQRGGEGTYDVTMGDIVITQMKTRKGILITLTHDTTLPRPRSLDFELQGTKGIWQGEHRRIYIEGHSPYEQWEDDEIYISEYEDPCWKRWGEEALRWDAHHQGMDYVMLQRVALDRSGGEAYPVGLEDLMLWTSITLYSKQSIAEKRTLLLTAPENL